MIENKQDLIDAILKCAKLLEEQNVPNSERYILFPKWLIRKKPKSKKKRQLKKYYRNKLII